MTPLLKAAVYDTCLTAKQMQMRRFQSLTGHKLTGSQGRRKENAKSQNENIYIRSSPCDLYRKRPALVRTTFVKPRLNFDLNFVMKSSRKRR